MQIHDFRLERAIGMGDLAEFGKFRALRPSETFNQGKILVSVWTVCPPWRPSDFPRRDAADRI